MNIKNKIIKWLGGYTADEIVKQQKIEFVRTEKQFIPIKATFAAKSNDFSDAIRHNLSYQIAEYVLEFNLAYYDVEYNPSTDCYFYKAVLYVREP